MAGSNRRFGSPTQALHWSFAAWSFMQAAHGHQRPAVEFPSAGFYAESIANASARALAVVSLR